MRVFFLLSIVKINMQSVIFLNLMGILHMINHFSFSLFSPTFNLLPKKPSPTTAIFMRKIILKNALIFVRMALYTEDISKRRDMKYVRTFKVGKH